MSLQEVIDSSMENLNAQIFKIDVKKKEGAHFEFVHLKIQEF